MRRQRQEKADGILRKNGGKQTKEWISAVNQVSAIRTTWQNSSYTLKRIELLKDELDQLVKMSEADDEAWAAKRQMGDVIAFDLRDEIAVVLKA